MSDFPESYDCEFITTYGIHPVLAKLNFAFSFVGSRMGWVGPKTVSTAYPFLQKVQCLRQSQSVLDLTMK